MARYTWEMKPIKGTVHGNNKKEAVNNLLDMIYNDPNMYFKLERIDYARK